MCLRFKRDRPRFISAESEEGDGIDDCVCEYSSLTPGDPVIGLTLGAEIYLMDRDGTNVRRLKKRCGEIG
jgi:hypothetical protein